MGKLGPVGVGSERTWMDALRWVRGKTTPQSANLMLEQFVDHIDHVCQLAGNARQAGIGSDLDGAFGCEQTPADLNTIADLAKIPTLLAARGYTPADVDGLMSGNFISFLKRTWK